ncbi:hypothetical protein AAFF_G00200910 [Aldrovandia affinis]|uniref:Uncharacterized protein n=1 Tax=Aldrovandia affinis TaxID=143900 RepID=A0AAD7RI32_9TELE|nr:hypothetical protein AAFF_G00200910 [Aldrovandia affinis]
MAPPISTRLESAAAVETAKGNASIGATAPCGQEDRAVPAVNGNARACFSSQSARHTQHLGISALLLARGQKAAASPRPQSVYPTRAWLRPLHAAAAVPQSGASSPAAAALLRGDSVQRRAQLPPGGSQITSAPFVPPRAA